MPSSVERFFTDIAVANDCYYKLLYSTTTFEELIIKLTLSDDDRVKDSTDIDPSVFFDLLNHIDTASMEDRPLEYLSVCSDHAFAILKELAEEIDLSKHFTTESIMEVYADLSLYAERCYNAKVADMLKDLKAKLISRISIVFDKKSDKHSIQDIS